MLITMNTYRTNLAEHLLSRKAICKAFFTATTAAEVTCQNISKSESNVSEQNAAQAVLTCQIRTAGKTFSDAMEKLGPPPAMPS